MKRALISIIIPTFQRPESLKRTIKSVLSQTFTEFELIIVNDSNEEAIVLELIKDFNDERIRYFRNRRTSGANGARNTGLIESVCDIVAFLDDDDIWLNKKLSEQYSVLKNSEKDIGGVWSAVLKKSGVEWIPFKSDYNSLNEQQIKDILLGNVYLHAGSNLMIKKGVINSIGLFDESLLRYQDYDFIIRILNVFKLYYIDKTHVKIFPGNQNNPYLLESAFNQFSKKIQNEINKLDKNEKNDFYTHQYYSFAKLFSENGNVFKTFFYLIKITKYKIINPFSIIKFIFLSIKNNLLKKKKK